MKTSIFIRSYIKDFPWLAGCVDSIHKFASGFEEIVIHVDNQDLRFLPRGIDKKARVVSSAPHCRNGYINQQVIKLNAHRWCKGDVIMFIDSDCMVYDKLTPSDLLVNEKPLILCSNYADVGEAICWKVPTEDFIRQDVSHEYMRRMPMAYWASTLSDMADWFKRTNRGELAKYVSQQWTFSEFNAIGAYCWIYSPEKYSWLLLGAGKEATALPVRQFWSHAGVNRHQQEIKNILGR